MSASDPASRYLSRLESALWNNDVPGREEILSDIRSLIQEHLDAAGASPEDLDGVLERLGPPEKLAETYRMESLLLAAGHSSAPILILKTALRWALTGVLGFVTAILLLVGYCMALGFFVTAALKPFLPHITGLWIDSEGRTCSFGIMPGQTGGHELLGYWTIPVGIIAGLFCFVVTTLLARWSFRRGRALLTRRLR